MCVVAGMAPVSSQQDQAPSAALPSAGPGSGFDGTNPFTRPVPRQTKMHEHCDAPSAPVVPTPVTAQQAHTAPVAVVAGSRRQPRIAFVTHAHVDSRTERRIRKIAGLKRRAGTVYHHPIYGPIQGSWVTNVVPDMSLLHDCILDTLSGTGGTDLEGIRDLASLAVPLVTRGDTEGTVELWPRLLGYEKAVTMVPAGALWTRGQGHWEMPTTSLIGIDGTPRPGMIVGDRTLYHEARRSLEEGKVDLETAATMSRVAAALDPIDVSADYTELAARVGDVPDWFGMELRPYQRTAAVAMVAGLRLLADEPGTGKTVMSLAATAIMGSERLLITAPSNTLSHWAREARRTRLPDHMGEGAAVVTIVAGRKQKPLPPRGVVIVTPSLLRSREQLKDQIVAWSPDQLIYDEAHSSKTWHSKISTTMREVARSCGAAFTLTGTPMLKSPDEVAPLLEISGLLDPVFGGYSAFTETFMTKNRFNAWVPKAGTTGILKERLDGWCWVRRTKAQVQTDLPPKVRSARVVDVKPSALVDAHRKVLDRVGEWLDKYQAEHGLLPDGAVVERWSKNNIGLSSPLREATGMVKIPAAAEHVVEWASATGRAADGTWTRPLIVWAHHHVVMDALAEALQTAGVPFARIGGGTSAEQTGRIVDEFQAGRWPILLASIHAAGTGITLTRASDELFVEADWTNAIMSQAESRAHRHGQTSPVLIETLIAPGTLDVSIQSILRAKAKLLRETTPSADVDVAVLGPHDEVPAFNREISSITEPWQVVNALVEEEMKRRV